MAESSEEDSVEVDRRTKQIATFAPPTDDEYEECKAYRVNVISNRAREKAQKHRERVDADIARRNHEAKLQKEADDKRTMKDQKEEQERLFRLSCHQNRNSALHIDQYEYDLGRKQRLETIHRLKQMRKKRSQIVTGPPGPVLKPVPLKPDTVYVGSNPVGYHVVPNKVILAMAMNTKLVEDQLVATKRHRRALSKLIKRELEDTKNMFPTLLNDTSRSRSQKDHEENRTMIKPGLSQSNQRSRPSSAMLWTSLDPLDPLPAVESNKENINNNSSSSSNHQQRWTSSANTSHSTHNSPMKGVIRRPLSSPGFRSPSNPHDDATDHLMIRPQSSPPKSPHSPFVFVPVRQQRPTSPYLRFIQDVEKMSVRFDTPSVPLANPTRPHLPPIITILDVLSNYEL